jgi:diguanylate cyclase (GGDEF)-like protein/PAS domain S-box-containing protein
MMSPAKRHYLYRKLATSVFGVALLFAALTSAIFFMTEFKRSSEKTAVMLDQLLDTVESTAAIAAYTSNRQIGEDVLKGLLRNDIVHQARLANDRGLELIETRTTEVPSQAEVVRTLHSPFGDAEVIGRLVIVPEAQYNLLEARHSALLSALNSSVLIGLTALFVLLLVRSSLSRPLMKVSDALHAITAGEQERLELLSSHRNDELGQLVDDINNLLDTLQEKFTVEHSLREEIQAVEQQLSSLFETTSAGIFLLDATGHLLKANPTLGRVLGLPGMPPEKLVGQDFPALAFAEPERLRELMRHAGERRQTAAMDMELKSRGDAPGNWVHCLVSRQTDATGGARFEGVVYDITERLATERRIRHDADHDPLTGLLRRHAAERSLMRLMETSPNDEHAPAVLLLDLDSFKQVNDTHGHDAGDAVLVETAKRLKSCVRTDDIAARLGGDEFLIVLANGIPHERAHQIARDIVVAIRKPIRLGPALAVHVGVSIGIGVYGGRGQTLEELYKAADQAMYEVKRHGKNGFGIVSPDGAIVVEKVANEEE